MATAVLTGFVSFGLISVPVKLYAAARSEGFSFNQVHQCESGAITKIKQQTFCPCCEKTVSYGELSKGFEINDGQYAVIGEDELKALSPAKSNTIEVAEFVKMTEVDPIFFDKSYFVVPGKAGEKAYKLLYETMGTSGLAGRATLVMRGTEYNVFIRVYRKGLMIHTVFAQDEVRDLPEFNTTREEVAVSAGELKMAKALLESLVVAFDPSKLKKEYDAKVQGLLDAKRAEASVPVATEVPDIMEKMKAMLDAIDQRAA